MQSTEYTLLSLPLTTVTIAINDIKKCAADAHSRLTLLPSIKDKVLNTIKPIMVRKNQVL